ncbi:hypothetical protein MCHI_000738 [Candidatus Magnetoovum chiemensis]|nr:hypothetical protein MCHI_000738 [Candidatus Magnetoovum chiemensis]
MVAATTRRSWACTIVTTGLSSVVTVRRTRLRTVLPDRGPRSRTVQSKSISISTRSRPKLWGWARTVS